MPTPKMRQWAETHPQTGPPRVIHFNPHAWHTMATAKRLVLEHHPGATIWRLIPNTP
ncbi:MAG: hypothetical protein ACYTEX_28055 [Planctomycetota bacterium]|jgi:hypothetical protein